VIALTEAAALSRHTPSGDRHVIARAEDMPPGTRRIVEIGARSIGVLNVDGQYHALMNVCPHHGAPLCEGVVKGTMQDSAPHEYQYGRHNEFIVCPWHGYEFELKSGRTLASVSRMRVRVYKVAVEDGDVVLYA
jgi:nitrite reductase/ring-hydroxylating ferredoxin subunit